MDEQSTIEEVRSLEVKPVQEEKLYPGWKNAQEKVLQILETDGYGTIITNEQLRSWFYMEPLQYRCTHEEYVSYESKFYNSVTSLKNSLRENHCICLSNEQGVGYEILHPDDQIKIEAQKYKQRCFNNLDKEKSLLMNVRVADLSVEAKRIQSREMAHIAFMTQGMNKKGYIEAEKKMIEED